ncbi:MAG: DNA primase [Candidatus Doudnabacteria bacterium]|nr:DNA primase [Candidatus Doudnabacteria bacterium]
MSDIEEIKNRLDIVSIVGEYVPDLKRAGQSFKAPCPFHKEKTPSFIVTPSIQLFKCFGCGEGGDVIKFIQKIERVEFGEALQIAASKAGYELKNQSSGNKAFKEQSKRVLEMNNLACSFWEFILHKHNAGKPGRDYATKRKLAEPQLKLFRIGYAPKGNNLLKFLLSKGFNQNELLTNGLVVERNGQIIDKFRDRLMLPILNAKGDVLGFSGRIVTPNEYAPKYLNSPETAVYKKGEILMGLHQAIPAMREHKFVILEEGNIDLLSSHRVKVGNILATGGTALTLEQCKLIKRYVDIVYFCFDSDNAGLNALIKGIGLAEQAGLKHKALDIGQHQDPDALISADPQSWERIIAQPINSVELVMKRIEKEYDLGTPDGKSDLFARMIPVLQSLKDKVQLAHFAEELAVKVGVQVDDVHSAIKAGATRPPLRTKASESTTVSVNVAPHFNNKEIYLLSLLLQVPNLKDLDISQEVFSDPACKDILVQMQKTSDFATISANISDAGREALQQALALDVLSIEDPKAEAARVYRMLYTTSIRKEILNLRQALHENPDNEELLAKLQYYSKELRL